MEKRMQLLRTEGIILQAIRFQDYDQILTVLTKDQGVVKFIIKKSINSSPLTQAEFVYTQGKSDIWKCREIHPLNHYLDIRKSLAHLENGCEFLKTIQHSQMEHKPCEPLYQLLVTYLEKIPHFSSPSILLASFYMKLLRYEGHLPLTLETTTFLHFNEEETKYLILLTFSRSFQSFHGLELPKELFLKIKELFHQAML